MYPCSCPLTLAHNHQTPAPPIVPSHDWLLPGHVSFTNMRWSQQCWTNVRLMMAHSRRRWPNITPALGQRLVFAGDQSIENSQYKKYNIYLSHIVIFILTLQHIAPVRYKLLSRSIYYYLYANEIYLIFQGFFCTENRDTTMINYAMMQRFIRKNTIFVFAWITVVSQHDEYLAFLWFDSIVNKDSINLMHWEVYNISMLWPMALIPWSVSTSSHIIGTVSVSVIISRNVRPE